MHTSLLYTPSTVKKITESENLCLKFANTEKNFNPEHGQKYFVSIEPEELLRLPRGRIPIMILPFIQ